ncbi:MAG: LysR family transcriptional regulator [Clostridia bacterium]|nr:LysR family transcriptional regulator [Clostridia bacterium]
MDLLKLKYFYIVAEKEHVTKAAEELHVAQPAITKSIKLLERDLGVSLFYRFGRNIRLTEYGVLLKKRLDGVFPIIDAIPAEIEQLKKDNKYTVRLNVLAASNAVMEAVVKYKNKNPEVIFNLVQNQEKPDCDISVTTDSADILGVETKKRCVLKERIFLAVPKNSDYALMDSIDLADVKEEKFINIAGSRPFRAICDKMCENAGFKPTIGFESDSPIAVQNIISAEAGIGFWPEFSWRKINAHNVVLLPIKNQGCSRGIIIELHEFSEKSNYAENFYEFLIDYLRRKQK